MSQQNWHQVKEIFLEVIDLMPTERMRRLAELCGGDPELRRAVEILIQQDAEADSLLQRPLAESSGIHLFADRLEDVDPLIGGRLGKYEIVREIGSGGMGAVYLARRADGAFQKDAAIKIVKRGMDTKFVVRRFRQERQILAALNHPFIARLLDGGTTEDGLPYFVMEHVTGESLYDFADRRRLSIGERLQLFRRICEAVEYAHQKQVIHRDLKPSNILIKADGSPKLLDFGIAKVLNPDIGITTVDPTLTAMRMMTPEYASPEQIKGETVSPASDVYSLGVILYEFLSGHRPYRIKNRAAYEIARAVCEDEPERPSSNITRDDNFAPTGEKTPTLETLYQARGANSLEELRRALSDDLECIVLKALRKNAAERYQTAAEFAADVLRYLDGADVCAKIDLRQRKNPARAPRVEVNAKSLAVLPLNFLNLGANADTGDEFLSVGLADALVSRLSGVQRLVLRPTSSVLRFGAGSDPFAAGRELAVEFVLIGSIRRAGERLRVTAQLLNVPTNATLWSQSFDEDSADVLALEDSLSEKIADSLLPQLTGDEVEQLHKRDTNNPAAYEAYLRGRYFWNQFTPESLSKALDSFQTAIALDANYALPHVGVADFHTWANIYGLIPSLPALEEAERHARRAVEIDEHLGEAYATLGHVAHNRRRWAESEKLKLRSIKLNPNYVHAREWWAAQLVGLGRGDEGVAEMKRAESLDPLSLRLKTLTAWTFYQAHRFDEALERAKQIIELDKNYPQGYSQIGFALWAMGRHAEALPHFQKFDAMIPDSALPKYQLCFALESVKRTDEARRVLNEMKTLAANGYVKPYFLAMAHVAVGDRDAAFEYFEQSFSEYEPWLLWFGTDPMLESLHGDARFVHFLERMNNPIAERFKKRVSRSNKTPAFAVLPFKLLQFNTGESSEDEFLSIGLTDALITRLSKIRSIMVRPTSAVVRFADARDSFQAGLELEADFVLAGNIRRAGERVRVSAQLLDVAGKSTAWAETFDEKFTDVLELEDLISERVADSLAPQLTGEEQKQLHKRETDSPEAYEAYLKGRFYWSLMTEEGFSKAIGFYERAVALDPNYALAYAAIAEYYIFLAIHCVIPFSQASRLTKEAAQKAVAIDPQLSEAQAALGIAAINSEFDWKKAEKYLRRAIETSPNSLLAHSWYQNLLFEGGRFEEALQELNRVLELNPDTLLSLHYLAWAHYHTRRFDESVEVHCRILENEPNYAWGHLTFSWLLRCAGNAPEALKEAKKGVELATKNPMYLTGLAAAFAANGQREKALETLDTINEMAATRYVAPYMLATAYCSLGDSERAFELLRKALAERDVWVLWLYADPQFDRLRNDPRFNDLLRRMKHPSVE